MSSRYRGRKQPRDGAAPLDTGPVEPLPKRSRARKRIEAPLVSETPLPDATQGRKLTESEREELRGRHTERHATPLPMPAKRRGRASHWWAKASIIVVAGVLIGAIGTGQFFGAARPGSPVVTRTPTSSPTPIDGQVAVLVLTSTPTPSISPTPSPTATNTPTATPTPNPAYRTKVICLDPGHGGSDRGFTRKKNDGAPALEEAVLTLQLALDLRAQLEMLGFKVVLTRDTDADVNANGADVNGDGETRANLAATDPVRAERAGNIDELQARIDICNEAKADLLVSMHLNGFDDPKVSGYETWYSSARPFVRLNRAFAQFAFDDLGRAMREAGYNATARRVNDDVEANASLSGDEFDRYIITGPARAGTISPSLMPGAIVEALFVSNDDDAAFLATDAGIEAIVLGYQRAIARYFDTTAD